MSVCVHFYVFMHSNVCVHFYVFMRSNVCVYVCVCECVHACTCVCMCVFAQKQYVWGHKEHVFYSDFEQNSWHLE